MTTTNLGEFGYHGLKMSADILGAVTKDGLPNGFSDDNVHLEFNKSSQCVFLTNNNYQCAKMHGGQLKMWCRLDNSDIEGFADALYKKFKNELVDTSDFNELADILEAEGMQKEAKEVKAKLKEIKKSIANTVKQAEELVSNWSNLDICSHCAIYYSNGGCRGLVCDNCMFSKDSHFIV